ncbi:hypothetical protein [Pseudoduganella sp. R-34]|uniref:hypothetical protein n=1 Tax=unclassified Pseudoduganella TaxID=2637179 RepID=UPI003CEF9556
MKPAFLTALSLLLSCAAAPAIAGEAYAPFGLRCVAAATNADSTKVAESLSLRFSKVWGKDWLTKPTPPGQIDPKVMEEVVAISACAAIVDCPNYFNREIGGDLTVFTDIGTKVPLRRQFDAAVAALPASEGKTALQSCMKLEAKK